MSQNLIINKNIKLSGNSVRLPIGTEFSFTKVSKNGIQSHFNDIKVGNNNVFFVFTDEEDVDFKINVNNISSIRGITFSVNLSNYLDSIYVKPYHYSSFKAIKSCGPKFHIKSQSTDEGKGIVSLNAQKHGITLEESSIHCSRITFNVTVERQLNQVFKPQIVRNPVVINRNKIVEKVEIECIGDKIQVFVRTIRDKMILLKIGTDNTVEDLKIKVSQREGIPTNLFRLISLFKPLYDCNTISESGIVNLSTLHISHWLKGGKNNITFKSIVDHNYSLNSTLLDIIEEEDSEESEVDEYEVDEYEDNNVIVCFGDKSNQILVPYYDFKPDLNYGIYSFTIEFRKI